MVRYTVRKKLGVDLNDLLVSQPDTGEQALEIVDALVKSGSVDLVVDSVAALTPEQKLTGIWEIATRFARPFNVSGP